MAWCAISFFSIASVSCVKLFSANTHNGSRDIDCTWYELFHTSTQIRSSRFNFLFLHVNSTHLVDDSHASRVPTFQHRVASNRQFQRFVRTTSIPFIQYIWCIQFWGLPITCYAYACDRHVPTCRNRPSTYHLRLLYITTWLMLANTFVKSGCMQKTYCAIIFNRRLMNSVSSLHSIYCYVRSWTLYTSCEIMASSHTSACNISYIYPYTLHVHIQIIYMHVPIPIVSEQ